MSDTISLNELSKEVGKHPTSVMRIVGKDAIVRPGGRAGEQLLDASKAKEKLAEKGKLPFQTNRPTITLKDAESKSGVNRVTLMRWLDNAGVLRRARGRGNSPLLDKEVVNNKLEEHGKTKIN